MDVVFRVNDPDDATVKVRALAFVDGVRSFAKVLRPVTFVEGTASKIGDAIASNTDHTLTWDVAADWSIDLGQVKLEILARDGRGLLAFDWITIPAAGSQPALTISKDAPSNASVLDGLFWQYADGDSALTLTNGVLKGNPSSGFFDGETLANGSALYAYSSPFILKRMNLDPAKSSAEVAYAAVTGRSGLLAAEGWHAINRPYSGVSRAVLWGANDYGLASPPELAGATAIVGGYAHFLALNGDGTVVAWGYSPYGAASLPGGLSRVIAISAGDSHNLALKSDGTVVGWGRGTEGQTTIPAGLTSVIAIAAGGSHSLAVKSDGTVIGWGGTSAATIPTGLTGVTAVAAGAYHSVALKSDGTILAWGEYYNGSTRVTMTAPAGLTGVAAIAAGVDHQIALKTDGTVVAWGYYNTGSGVFPMTVPPALSGVTAIAAGRAHNVAMKSDGTVVAWGANSEGQTSIPASVNGVMAVAAAGRSSLALKSKVP
jgi:Regulator of chromosome condensation (RCC1) repeat